ncbi:Asp23/Gls24 family envelope stress response protein [Corynebacterium terpenotabidum]|uniref:Alkaline shock response membrane anchor protein AmaP n=1 Tax=Corynebacterium terpenotabidum Y-11 TaxID=1200352 RepID=S4XGE9_9CORY|nr:hypothetical protein [Corynebacterium terpenotabidum]AGP31616.1 hypothetical protein A606_09885 [Corynebacterium terpenotabidum Y-11]
MNSAPAPAASPRARWWTILLGIVFLALGGVGIHDLLIVTGHITTDPLLPPVYDWFAEVQYAGWLLAVAIGCALVALILFIATVRPRVRTHLAFAGGSELYARPVDIARMSTAAARRSGGVLRASTVATRKKITVTVVTAAGEDAERTALAETVDAEVTRLASLLDPVPSVTVKVTTRTPGGDRP